MQLARKTHLSLPASAAAEPHPEDLHDDVRIVELAKADPRAFAPLYERYSQAIYAFCYRRLGHPDEAADATAIVFTRALAALPRFRPGTSRPGSTFRAWLYKIARNVVTDFHRRSRNHASLDQPDSPLLNSRHVTDPSATPEDHAIGAEEARLVNTLLRQLPERQRAVVELRLAGLSMAEISSALGVTESAAKSLQVRAYRALRELLESDPHAVSREFSP